MVNFLSARPGQLSPGSHGQLSLGVDSIGFPSKIQDAAILELLLGNCDPYPHAEERRLYYVALTRAKKKAILLTVKDQESEFILELREKFAEELKKEPFTCPLCGGCLIRKSGPYGDFFGCSSYKTAGCKYTRKIVKGNPLKEQNSGDILGKNTRTKWN